MFDQPESFVTSDGRTIGGVMMEMKNITLRFGGVVAIRISLLISAKVKFEQLSARMALENPQC